MQLANGITVDIKAMARDTGIHELTIKEILAKVPTTRFMKKMTLNEELDCAENYGQILSVYCRIRRLDPENNGLLEQAYNKMVQVSLADLFQAKTRDDVREIHTRTHVAVDPQLKLEMFTRLAQFFIVVE